MKYVDFNEIHKAPTERLNHEHIQERKETVRVFTKHINRIADCAYKSSFIPEQYLKCHMGEEKKERERERERERQIEIEIWTGTQTTFANGI